MIDFKCKNCSEAMSVPDSLAGQPEKCPNCGYCAKVPGQSLAVGNKETVMSEPEGIGGWLILPAIGLIGGPIANATNIIRLHRLKALYNLFGDLPSSIKSAIMWQTLILLVFICFQICVAVLFFRKKRIAPGAFITLLIGNLIVSFICAAWTSDVFNIPFKVGGVVGAVVYSAVWIPYFLLSKRVKNTFTE